MTILISSPVRRRLRVAAAVQDRDISQVIEAAVQMYLDSWERDRAARGLPPLTVE
jgi:predicted transcriptional regulator